MSQVSPKGSLPHGWIVKTSKHYPDRVYYFNIHTGVSAWECPELDPPRVLSEEADNKEIIDKKDSNVSTTQLISENSSQSLEMSLKAFTPPTAVVVPVVHKKNERTTIQSQTKRKRQKSIDSEKPKSVKSHVSETKEKKSKKKKLKKVSPLLKSDSEKKEISGKLSKVNMKKPSQKTHDVQNIKEPSPGPSSKENSIKDVEMRDVSMDLINDLSEKKETVFDTTACYYIVVDTNVLIGELHLISELKDTPLDGCGPPHIFIPWVVIEELDKLKAQRNLLKGAPRGASEAIRYLNSVLSKHPRFHGQSPAEAEKWAKTYSKCNDDKILECCMALKDKMPAEKVILLTNDKNLVNKALICDINVHNFESMMKKVKPDTVFNCEKRKTKKKKEKDSEEVQNRSISEEERFLQKKRNSHKCEIHTIMSNARLLLKDVLSKFLSEEMFEAYGDMWLKFPIETKLLKGILEGIRRYWSMVFSMFLSEKDKRNFELLLEKASRPEGFLGDKDECLLILSAIEDVFRQIKKRQPKLNVPVEQIQDYRVACVNAFIACSEAESSIRLAEEKNIHVIFDRNWNVINQLCGVILDHYKIPHDFNYDKINQPVSEFELRRVMTVFYPGVQTFRKLLKNIYDAIQNGKPVKALFKNLTTALLEFIPSLRLPYDSLAYPFVNQKALERFLTCSQNRQMLEVGIKQIEKFYSKLDEALRVMLLPGIRNNSPDPETMICD